MTAREYRSKFVGERVMLVWSVVRRRYEFRCPYELREVARAAGLHWDPEALTWYASDRRHAVKLIQYADPSAKAQLVFEFAA